MTNSVIASMISITIDNLPETSYSYQVYSGSNSGILIITIFLNDDFYLNTLSTTARVFINGTQFTNRLIKVNCRKRFSYSKVLANSEGGLVTQYPPT